MTEHHPSFDGIMSTDLQISPTLRYKIKEGPLTVAGTDVDTSTLSKGDSETYPLSRKQIVKARIQLLALFLCMYLGWNDGGLGALLPRIQRFYDVSYIVVSLIFVMDSSQQDLSMYHLSIRLALGRDVRDWAALFRHYIYPAFPFSVLLSSFLLNGFGFYLLASGMSGYYVAILKENNLHFTFYIWCWRSLLTIHSDRFSAMTHSLVFLLSNVFGHSAYKLGHHTLGLQTQVTRCAIAEKWGIESLQPFLVVMMAVMIFV